MTSLEDQSVVIEVLVRVLMMEIKQWLVLGSLDLGTPSPLCSRRRSGRIS